MDIQHYPDRVGKLFQRNVLGDLDASVAARMVSVSGDVAMIIDKNGIICDLALNNADMSLDGFDSWLDKRWSDTVTKESRIKVEELLRDARNSAETRWREINHPTVTGDSIAIRYVTVDTGHEGRVIAIGRDNRAAAQMQQRLLQAQQSMERDYARIRDAESRYRLLFAMSAEAVLVVDAGSRRILEANPAADRLVGGDGSLIGKPFARLFAIQSQDEALAMMSAARSATNRNGALSRLVHNGRELAATASIFRQDRAEHFLIRLTPPERGEASMSEANRRLLEVVERLPEGFVLVDDELNIVAVNTAFLDLVQLPTQSQAVSKPIMQFLGVPSVDRNILIDTLRKHGVVRNFPTVLRGQYGEQEDVEICAVSAHEGSAAFYGFTIRSVIRREPETARLRSGLPRSAADMSDLVGRVSLKEIVRDTTDFVERLCIEAALELTSNNRASAAEVLGLSRQSLYSKLHRFGLGNLGADQE